MTEEGGAALESITVSELAGKYNAPDSGRRVRAAEILVYILGGSLIVALGAVYAHSWTAMPTVEDARAALGPQATPDEILRTYERLVHVNSDRTFEELRNCVSVLAPIFTLAAGYLFSRREE